MFGSKRKIPARLYEVIMGEASRIARKQNAGSTMRGLLYPERQKLSNKNFIREHVNGIRTTQKENRMRKIEESDTNLRAHRMRQSLLEKTISRYNKENSSQPPRIRESEGFVEAQTLHSNFGKVPAYIEEFRVQKQEALRKQKEFEDASKIPQGCRFMTTEERLSSLEDVRRSRTHLLEEVKTMPLSLTTLKQRRRKIEIDLKLTELDKLALKLEKNFVLIKE